MSLEVVARIRADSTQYDEGVERAVASMARFGDAATRANARSAVASTQAAQAMETFATKTERGAIHANAALRRSASAMQDVGSQLLYLTGTQDRAVLVIQRMNFGLASTSMALANLGGPVGAVATRLSMFTPHLAAIGAVATLAIIGLGKLRDAFANVKTSTSEATKAIEAHREALLALDRARVSAVGKAREAAQSDEAYAAAVQEAGEIAQRFAAQNIERGESFESVANRIALALRERENPAMAETLVRLQALADRHTKHKSVVELLILGMDDLVTATAESAANIAALDEESRKGTASAQGHAAAIRDQSAAMEELARVLERHEQARIASGMKWEEALMVRAQGGLSEEFLAAEHRTDRTAEAERANELKRAAAEAADRHAEALAREQAAVEAVALAQREENIAITEGALGMMFMAAMQGKSFAAMLEQIAQFAAVKAALFAAEAIGRAVWGDYTGATGATISAVKWGAVAALAGGAASAMGQSAVGAARSAAGPGGGGSFATSQGFAGGRRDRERGGDVYNITVNVPPGGEVEAGRRIEETINRSRREDGRASL